MKGSRITIKDIARIAGVSHSTVSRSLNDSPLISKDTKERIQRIAAAEGFEFNASAQSLSTSRTGTVGIVYPELFDTFGNTLYLGLLVTGIRHALEEVSLDSLGIFPVNQYTGESNIKKLITRRKVDGLLIIHPEIDPDDWEFILASGVPFVVLHFKPRSHDYSTMNCFFTDHVDGGYQATKHLITLGCKNILTLTEDSKELQFKERTQGYRNALNEAGIETMPNYIIGGNCSFEFGYETMMRNRHLISKLDGIFAQADIMALGAIEALRVLGVDVPGDIKVVGYDDTELGKYFRPRLTTVHQPREEHAQLACSRLIEMIGVYNQQSKVKRKENQEKKEGQDEQYVDEPVQEVLKPRLVVRESCGSKVAGYTGKQERQENKVKQKKNAE